MSSAVVVARTPQNRVLCEGIKPMKQQKTHNRTLPHKIFIALGCMEHQCCQRLELFRGYSSDCHGRGCGLTAPKHDCYSVPATSRTKQPCLLKKCQRPVEDLSQKPYEKVIPLAQWSAHSTASLSQRKYSRSSLLRASRPSRVY